MELTGNPTATLSSASLFVPASRLTGPLKVNCLFSLVPKADPVIIMPQSRHQLER